MKKILVTGGSGQLGSCLRKLSENYTEAFQFDFQNSRTLDITDGAAVSDYFESQRPDFCINAAAYTAVDKAESDEEKAYAVNALGVENLAKACAENGTVFIHISTDYVFDGDTQLPYEEGDSPNPQGVYGASKLKGEELALAANPETIILRTSWLYSEFSKNFVKTMLTLFSQKDELNVVADQYGQPTNANDLAEAIMKIIESKNKTYGIFHFSNYPETTWYDFASKIAESSKNNIKIHPIPTSEYPTPAKRPARSTMSLEKIERTYGIEPKHWEASLEECLEILI